MKARSNLFALFSLSILGFTAVGCSESVPHYVSGNSSTAKVELVSIDKSNFTVVRDGSTIGTVTRIAESEGSDKFVFKTVNQPNLQVGLQFTLTKAATLPGPGLYVCIDCAYPHFFNQLPTEWIKS